MSALFLVGRILFVIVFLVVPLGVIRASAQVAGAPPLRRVPFRRFSVVAASSTAMLAAVLVILGIWPDLGALLIAGYLIPVTFVMHPFWSFADSAQQKSHRESFLLNLSILGGALIFFWAMNQTQHVPVALVSTPLFGPW